MKTFATRAEQIAYEQGRADGIVETWACVGTVADLMPGSSKANAHDASPMKLLADRIAELPDRAVLRILRPFDPHDALTTQQAAARALVSESAIRGWAEVYSIGRKKGGRLWISRVALDCFTNDDARALAVYLRDGLTSPLLLHYVARVGLAG